MWLSLDRSLAKDTDLQASVTDLLQSTSRNLILVTGVLYVLSHFIVTTAWVELFGIEIWAVLLIVVSVSVVAWHRLSYDFMSANVIWQLGLVLAITVALMLYRVPELALLYAIIPLFAATTLGWQAALVVELLISALTAWLSYSSLVWFPVHSYGWLVVAAGVLTGVLGWLITKSLLTVAEWSLSSYKLAQSKAEDALKEHVELVQMQEDLIKANQELARVVGRLKDMQKIVEDAGRAKEQFVANVSHEFRTPLNMIIGFADILTRSSDVYGVDLPVSLKSDIAAIRRNSQHLSRLVDDVLDLSQVESGLMGLSREWISLSDIVDEATMIVRPLFASKGLYLETALRSDLPPVYCDGTRIRQVLINLLSNSGRFTEQGGVRIEGYLDSQEVVVCVTDTGPGIAAGDQAKLFQPFVQLDASLHRKHGGTGLGLSISRRFVELHQGRMWIESELGKGTQIYFTLPLYGLPSETSDQGDWRRWFNPYQNYEARSRPYKAPPLAVPPRFVFLDNSGALQRLLCRHMPDAEVISVATVEEAFQELESSPAQALILNSLSVQNVRQTMRDLSQLPFGTPTIALSVTHEATSGEQLGVARYLVKPVTSDALLSALMAIERSVQLILLVDDDTELTRLYARMLSSAGQGYQLLRAKTGQRALALMKERRPDVVVLDLFMPSMSGLEVLHEKQLDPTISDIPVILLTARDPAGAYVVTDIAYIVRGGGLSVNDVLACIGGLCGALTTGSS